MVTRSLLQGFLYIRVSGPTWIDPFIRAVNPSVGRSSRPFRDIGCFPIRCNGLSPEFIRDWVSGVRVRIRGDGSIRSGMVRPDIEL